MAEGQQFGVLVLNQISPLGLKRLPEDRYRVGKDIVRAQAILLRSFDMHKMTIPDSVLAIGRAGAGTNNIPVKLMSERGVPVFNAPGANANAVKELVLAGMLMSSRNLPAALRFVQGLDPADAQMEAKVEDGKKTYAGFELAGSTLGIVGLGKIGSLVADAAIKLGMNVIGFDPEITVDAAWGLPAQVRRAASVNEVLRQSDFVTLHVPLVAATRNLINSTNLELARKGLTLLNFSREGVVDEAAATQALDKGLLRYYVCDFPSAALNVHPKVIALPHLGASTSEAEDNCAVMVADQLKEYLEHGNIENAVNFPNATMPRESKYRVAIANSNVPNMLGQISTAMAKANLNIHNMLNKSRGEIAYTIVDVDSAVPEALISALASIEGVLAVRNLPLG
jgi:D-3-phosphoglycerate dehydrogenase / 2-oxoglutarate reductase